MRHSAPKPSLWALGGLSPINLGKRVWKSIEKDELSVRSTSLAYYFILAVFPAMLFLISLIGLFASTRAELQTSLFQSLARVLPGSASELVQKTLHEVTQASSTGKAVFGILGALWAASQGVAAVMASLNVAYDVKETRNWFKQKVIAVGLTLALAILVLGALALMLFGADTANFVGSHFGLGQPIVIAWKVFQWPIVLGFMFLAFAVTYYFAPNLKEPEWHWITPGSAFGLACWLVASYGLKIYLHFFNSYSKTYGSLGAVIILLLWLYITGFSIMIGGEVNSTIGRATDERELERQRQQGRQKSAERDIKTLWGDGRQTA